MSLFDVDLIDKCSSIIKIHEPTNQHLAFNTCVFNSNYIKEGCIFIARKGENNDGHDYIEKAFQLGARGVIGEDKDKIQNLALKYKDKFFYLTLDILKACQELSSELVSKMNVPVMSISGASGKTTTKDIASSILRLGGEIVFTPETDNNFWGVPQTILKSSTNERGILLEFGTNSFGETKRLAEMATPWFSYFTGIGESHLEFFGDLDGVLKAETEAVTIMEERINEPKYIYNGDDEYLSRFFQGKKLKGEVFSVSLKNREASIYLKKCKRLGSQFNFGWEIEWSGSLSSGESVLPLLGKHNITNALGAIATCKLSGLCSEADILQGIREVKLTANRSEVLTLNRKNNSNFYLFNDSYNSNPQSLKAAISEAASLKSERLVDEFVLVLGDMLELGDNSKLLHYEAGRYGGLNGVSKIYTVGEYAKDYVEGFLSASSTANYRIYTTLEEMKNKLRDELSLLKEKSVVLVKGSRGSKMRSVAAKIKEDFSD